MKPAWIIALLLGPALSFADQRNDATPVPPGLPPFTFPHAPRAWLGLDVSKPDETITAHLPSLPPGIGFVIRSIDTDGPAAGAGLKAFDVIWKIGDQMLVNEGQLAALLRLFKPGEQIAISGFRGGKKLEVSLTLGETPPHKNPFPDEMVDDSILPRDRRGPMRISDVSLLDKRARYSNDEGSAEIRKEGESYKVKIYGPKEEIIFEGDITQNGSFEKIPERWKRRVLALRRGLDLALEGGMASIRQPRPRVVPPPGAKR